MEERFILGLSSVCSTWAKNTRSCFERFPFAHICCCCSGRQISYHYLFFLGSESVIHPFPDSALPTKVGRGDLQFPCGVISYPSLGHPRREDVEARPVWRLPVPAWPRPDPGSIKPGRAGPGQDRQAWKPHPGNVMTNSGSSGSSQSERWKTNFSSWKGCSWITALLLSLPTSALTSPALRDERWQKLRLVITGRLSAGINKLNSVAEVNELF